MSNKVTALAAVETRSSIHAFEPNGIDEAYRLCKILIAGKLLPRSVTSPEAAFTIVAAGRELGLSALMSLRSMHIIEGKITLSADLGVALVKRHPSCKYFRLVESTDKIATYETLRDGDPSPTRMSFTWEEASKAGVTSKDNWKRYAPAMLRARCSMALARTVYQDAMMGIYDPDEITERGPGPKRAMPAVLPAHDVETGEVLEEQLQASVEAPKSSGKLPEGPANDDDEQGELALMFAAEIHEAQAEAEVYEIGLRIKKANLEEQFAVPLREQVAAKKRAIREANAAQSRRREPGED